MNFLKRFGGAVGKFPLDREQSFLFHFNFEKLFLGKLIYQDKNYL